MKNSTANEITNEILNLIDHNKIVIKLNRPNEAFNLDDLKEDVKNETELYNFSLSELDSFLNNVKNN